MTKKQMMALKPGDIVVEKESGDVFRFLRRVEVVTILLKADSHDLVNPRTEIVVEPIPGLKYERTWGYQSQLYFRHGRLALKEACA